MRNGISSTFIGFCAVLSALLAACGDGSATGPSDPGDGAGSAMLGPFLDKQLKMTRFDVADSNGQVFKNVCGDTAACDYDDLFIESTGRIFVVECVSCPPQDPRNESGTWDVDPAQKLLIVTDADDTAPYSYRILDTSGALKLAQPIGELWRGIAIASGSFPDAGYGGKGFLLVTYSGE